MKIYFFYHKAKKLFLLSKDLKQHLERITFYTEISFQKTSGVFLHLRNESLYSEK